jgi:polyisoprenoid-binding protein YceI
MLRLRTFLIAIPVVAVLAFGGLWAFLHLENGSAPASVAGQATPPPVSCSSGASAKGAWQLAADGSSFVGYRVNERLASLPTNSDAVGRTTALTGSLTVTGTDLTAVSVTADLTQLHSNEERRDRFLTHDGLETDRFSKASFALTQPVALPATALSGSALVTTVPGRLTLHGQAVDVAMPVTAQFRCDSITVSGSLPITFADYSMTPPSIGGFVTVDDHGTMEMQVTFRRA